MIQSGQGRPLTAALVLLALLLVAAPTAPAKSRDNVVEVTLPRPAPDEMVLARAEIEMAFEARVAAVGRLKVRRVGGLPPGFGVAAVRARQRGDTVLVRLVVVRNGDAARAGPPMRVKLRVGDREHTYERAVTTTYEIGPESRVRRHRDCATINGEASRWRPVRRARVIRFGVRRFGALTAVGAAQEVACDRDIDTVPAGERFLSAVDPDYGAGGGGVVEGFYATWARDEAGRPRVCVYVRGRRRGEGDVTVAATTQPFLLSAGNGLARVDTQVAGEGEYAFRVRWRQPDGTYRQSESTIRIPASGAKGNDPSGPYAAAGNCG